MLHLENFFEKSFALLLTTPNCVRNIIVRWYFQLLHSQVLMRCQI